MGLNICTRTPATPACVEVRGQTFGSQFPPTMWVLGTRTQVARLARRGLYLRGLCSCPGHPHTASATPPGPCRASKHIHGNNHTHNNHDSDLAWSTPHPMFLVKRRGKQGHIGRGLPALHWHWSSASYHDFDVSALFHQIWSKHMPCCFCVEPGLSFTFFIEAGLSACRLLCLHLNWAPLGI